MYKLREVCTPKIREIRHSPAAVMEDESHKKSLPENFGWEGVVSRLIPESEDLLIQNLSEENLVRGQARG